VKEWVHKGEMRQIVDIKVTLVCIEAEPTAEGNFAGGRGKVVAKPFALPRILACAPFLLHAKMFGDIGLISD